MLAKVTSRFPLAAAAVAALPANSLLIDGTAIVINAKGLAIFDPIRPKRHSGRFRPDRTRRKDLRRPRSIENASWRN